MKIEIIEESGFAAALLGLGLSYGITSSHTKEDIAKDPELSKQLTKISNTLAYKDKGHNKFLESLVVWIDLTAPRYFWQQFDTYRIGVTKQSESTMHTLVHRKFTQHDFENPIFEGTLERLNFLISTRDFRQLKVELPEGFLQRRIICTNYKVLRHIISQRETHKLKEWREFIDEIRLQARHHLYLEGV